QSEKPGPILMNTGVRATGSLRRAVRVSSPAFRTERAMIAIVSCLCPVYESVSYGSSTNNIELNEQNVLICQRQQRTTANDDEFEMPPFHGENRGDQRSRWISVAPGAPS